ncbi:MAG: alanine racemase [Anaerolineales bacterium]
MPNPNFVALPPALKAALAALDDEPASGLEKGLPDIRLRFGAIGRQGWRLLAGDLPLPSMTLNGAAMAHNIRLMQAYCDRHGAWLAPHGKTTMAPQIFAAQLAAGAWAITLANIAQLQVARGFGIDRMFIANEMTSDYDLHYLGHALRTDPGFEPYVLVDSHAALHRLAEVLGQHRPGRPLNVLVELGLPGGRTGLREPAQAQELARAVAAEPTVRLAGVEGYEGIAPGTKLEDRQAIAGEFLARVAETARAIRPLAPGDGPFLVSAGGSMYFDQVVEHLGRAALPEAQLILRPGIYVTHDSGVYEERSPLGAVRGPSAPAQRLRPALEVWSAVLSRPEPGLALLSMGQRDMPVDLELPRPQRRSRAGAPPVPVGEGWTIFRANDQHAYLRLPPDADLQVGDLIGSGISHPCTAFDKWRVLLVVDNDYNITGAVKTFF